MGAIQPWHLIVVVLILVLLFGSKRLPDAARGLGRSMRILKAETKGLADEDKAASVEPAQQVAPPAPAPAPQVAPPAPAPQVAPSAPQSPVAPRDTSI
jgi:sec-independent protein translocase protein TatA